MAGKSIFAIKQRKIRTVMGKGGGALAVFVCDPMVDVSYDYGRGDRERKDGDNKRRDKKKEA